MIYVGYKIHHSGQKYKYNEIKTIETETNDTWWRMCSYIRISDTRSFISFCRRRCDAICFTLLGNQKGKICG
jgi:hypothetical protein